MRPEIGDGKTGDVVSTKDPPFNSIYSVTYSGYYPLSGRLLISKFPETDFLHLLKNLHRLLGRGAEKYLSPESYYERQAGFGCIS